MGRYDVKALRKQSQIKALVQPLLRPRPVGSPGHTEARQVGNTPLHARFYIHI